jgi:predicted DNA-binding protein (UPF0251 family)
MWTHECSSFDFFVFDVIGFHLIDIDICPKRSKLKLKTKRTYVNNKGGFSMPRPRKWRRVCCLPESNLFGPLVPTSAEKEIVLMTVEEYETIRLIDLEGMMQEECAERMNVARTTVQRIYNDARKKLAESLVNGKILKIEGGDYKLCDEAEPMYGCGRCRRHRAAQIQSRMRRGEET